MRQQNQQVLASFALLHNSSYAPHNSCSNSTAYINAIHSSAVKPITHPSPTYSQCPAPHPRQAPTPHRPRALLYNRASADSIPWRNTTSPGIPVQATPGLINSRTRFTFSLIHPHLAWMVRYQDLNPNTTINQGTAASASPSLSQLGLHIPAKAHKHIRHHSASPSSYPSDKRVRLQTCRMCCDGSVWGSDF